MRVSQGVDMDPGHCRRGIKIGRNWPLQRPAEACPASHVQFRYCTEYVHRMQYIKGWKGVWGLHHPIPLGRVVPPILPFSSLPLLFCGLLICWAVKLRNWVVWLVTPRKGRVVCLGLFIFSFLVARGSLLGLPFDLSQSIAMWWVVGLDVASHHAGGGQRCRFCGFGAFSAS